MLKMPCHVNMFRGMTAFRKCIPLSCITGLTLCMGLPAKADNCTTMLAHKFTPQAQRLPVTVTMHYAGDSPVDAVRYGAALLPRSNGSYKYAGIIEWLPNTHNFAPSNLTLAVEVSASGGVSVQQRLGGHPIGGFPPTQFQGTCSQGLVTGIIETGPAGAFKGGEIWTLSYGDPVLIPR
jgi:hypothetical protein